MVAHFCPLSSKIFSIQSIDMQDKMLTGKKNAFRSESFFKDLKKPTSNITNLWLPTCQMLLIHVEMQLIYIDIKLIYVNMQRIYYLLIRHARSFDMQFIYVNKMHVDKLISHVNITKLHISINKLHVDISYMSTFLSCMSI